MGRHYSFDDQRVGKGDGEFFKVTGTRDRPQRIAYIPCEAYPSQLIVSPQLEAQVKAGDPTAVETVEDIKALKEEIEKSLRRQIPSAEVWINEKGQKVILYAKTVGAKTFWIDGVGYVYWREGIPPECLEKPPQVVYGLVLLEYELDADNEPAILSPDRQIDLGGGHRLKFKYGLKPWSINDAKTRAWKEHSRTNPVIKNDYMIWQEKSGKFEKARFSPAGPALWRSDPEVMKRVIKEGRKMYENLHRLIAKDFSIEEIIAMSPQANRDGRSREPQATVMAEEIDFAKLLGSPQSGQDSVVEEHSAFHLENHNPGQIQGEFPDLGSAEGMESLIDTGAQGVQGGW